VTFAVTRHVPWALNTGRKRIFGVFAAQETCLMAANVRLFPSNEIYNGSKWGRFLMYGILPCSRLLNSTWLRVFYFGVF